MEHDPTIVQAIATPMLCRLSDVRRQTLDHWVGLGLVTPSYRGSQGRRKTRWWSIQDVVRVRVIKSLREAGCPLQQLRRAKRLLDASDVDLGETVLYWNGGDILELEKWGTVRSLIKRPGQEILHVVALPLRAWVGEAEDSSVTLDLRALSGVSSGFLRSGGAGSSRGKRAGARHSRQGTRRGPHVDGGGALRWGSL